MTETPAKPDECLPAAETETYEFPGYITKDIQFIPAPVGWRPRVLANLRKDMLAKNIFFTGHGGRFSILKMLIKDGSMATANFRVIQALQRLRLTPLAMILYKLGAALTGAVIGRHAQIGPGMVILHGHGILINSAVKAGRNLVLGNGVTIGAEKGQCPVLGDNVYIGTGAVVIGGIRIGHRARIGANAVVLHDVPDDGTAVGIPARVVRIRPMSLGRRIGVEDVQ